MMSTVPSMSEITTVQSIVMESSLMNGISVDFSMRYTVMSSVVLIGDTPSAVCAAMVSALSAKMRCFSSSQYREDKKSCAPCIAKKLNTMMAEMTAKYFEKILLNIAVSLL